MEFARATMRVQAPNITIVISGSEPTCGYGFAVDSVGRLTNSFVKSLADVLRSERERQGLSQTELAARAGLSQPHIGYIERGKRAPTVESLKRIALAMGRTATELVSMAEDAAGGGTN